MLIDQFLPSYDIQSTHRITVAATHDQVFRSIRALDLSDSTLANVLFRARGLPKTSLRLEGLLAMGFLELGEITGNELLLGIVGQFWKPSGSLIKVATEEFESFHLDGYSKAVWNFVVNPMGSKSCELVTETRVASYGRSAFLLFRLYWVLIGPFSAIVRREVLKSIKTRAEMER